MNKKLFLFLAVCVALTTSSFAQPNSSKDTSGPNVGTRLNDIETGLARFLDSDDDTPKEPGRVRIVESKASGVSASVTVKIASIEHVAFDIVNQKRIENGLKSLVWSDQLEGVARGHSQNMADFDFFSHRGMDNKMVSDRADDAHLGKWRAIGENIAFNRGFADPIAKAVQLWLDSTSHRNNMMNENWKEAAIGVAIAADGSYYFTQVFLARK